MNGRYRWYAGAWALAGVVWVINALTGLDAAGHTREFYVMISVFIPVHLLVLVGLVGLLRADVVGGSRVGRGGLYLAVVGRVAFIAGEVFALILGSEDGPVLVLLPFAAMATAVGMLVAGVSAVGARRWEGWRRFAPLAMGAYPFMFMFPFLAATGERPDVGVAFWGLTFLGVAGAVIAEGSREHGSRLAEPAQEVR